MVLIPDEGTVEKLASASRDPAFGDRVHARRPGVAEHSPDPGISEDRVERSCLVQAAITDHELNPVACSPRSISKFRACWAVHAPRRLQGDTEDADAPGDVPDHGQDVSLSAVEQVSGEVARQDRPGPGAQELRPGSLLVPMRGPSQRPSQDLPQGRRRCLHSQAGQLTVDPAVAPAGFSRASLIAGALMFRRPADLPVLPRMDLAAQRRRTIPRC
jgi:hypothetical protein